MDKSDQARIKIQSIKVHLPDMEAMLNKHDDDNEDFMLWGIELDHLLTELELFLRYIQNHRWID